MIDIQYTLVRNTSFFSRIIGLIGKKYVPKNTAVVIAPCKQVHTFFMRFAIDVLFFDSEGNVIGIETLVPWRVSRYYRHARGVVELNAGAASTFITHNVPIKI